MNLQKNNWRIDPSKTGLLIVDVQEKLFPAITDGEKILKKIKAAIEISKIFSIPIYLTEQLPEKLGPTLSPILQAIENPHPYIKATFSAASVLPVDLPKNILLTGIETHVCVRQTAYDLHCREKVVYVLADTMGSRSPLDHQLALNEMQQDEFLVSSLEAVTWEMVQEAGTDLFRKVLAVLK